MRGLLVKNGFVVNIVEYPNALPEVDEGSDVAADPGGISVGDAFDIVAYKSVSARATAIDVVTLTTKEGKILRALALTTIDEINVLRAWLESFKAQVALSTSLADLKTRVAGLPATPPRTLAQAKAAVTNNIQIGLVD